jgi:membrane fusion protein (multidrug efflux system)
MMSAALSSETATAPPKSRRGLIVLAVIIVAGVIGAVLYWLHARNYVSTDDAFIQADVVSISPRIAGTVLSVEIEDNQPVKAGQVLVQIDPRDVAVQVAQAQANYAAAQAQLQSAQAALELTRVGGDAAIDQAAAAVRSAEAEAARASADAARYQSLYARQEVSKQLLDQASTAARAAAAVVDQARSQLRNARAAPTQISQRQAEIAARAAQVDQAKAALDQAQLNLGYATVTAPVDGKITRKNVQVGQQVAPGAQLLAIVQNRPWVVANFKETQLAKMRIGQPVRFRIDGLAGVELSGRVDSFQSGTGSVFSLLPAENATGNFVKVVQRVPVKLVFDPAPDASHPLVPGMSVVPTVDISAEPQTDPAH